MNKSRAPTTTLLACVAGWIFGSVSVAASVETEIFKCRKVADGVKRLECYDALLNGASGEVIKTAPVSSGEWEVTTRTSKIDDSKNVYMSLKSIDTFRSKYGRQKHASMWVRCMENKTALYVDYDEFVTTRETTVTLRIDKKPAVRRRVSMSTNYQSWGMWSGGTSIKFIKSLFDRSRLLVHVTPHGESSVVVEFNVTGLKQAIRPLRTTCGW